MVQNGARRGCDGAEWWKMGRRWCKMVQDGGGDGAKWGKERQQWCKMVRRRGGNGAEWGKEGQQWCEMVQGGVVMVENGEKEGW